MKALLSLYLLFFSLYSFSQLNESQKWQYVLKLNKVDSTCTFGKWTQENEGETRLTYLGSVTTIKGKTFKIMTSVWIWGYSHRATSRILIFNEKNQYVGNYYMTMISDLPNKLENGYLIFTNKDNNDCDKKPITKINFNYGLPKEFYLKCNDTFEFSQ